MTLEEAIRLLDPETTGEAIAEIEYYNGFSGKTAAIQAITDACEIAVEAMGKQISNSKRAPFDSESISCGNCDSDISDSDYSHCPYCGQKLDWSCLSDTETTFECDGKTYIVQFDEDNEEEWE